MEHHQHLLCAHPVIIQGYSLLTCVSIDRLLTVLELYLNGIEFHSTPRNRAGEKNLDADVTWGMIPRGSSGEGREKSYREASSRISLKLGTQASELSNG